MTYFIMGVSIHFLVFISVLFSFYLDRLLGKSNSCFYLELCVSISCSFSRLSASKQCEVSLRRVITTAVLQRIVKVDLSFYDSGEWKAGLESQLFTSAFVLSSCCPKVAFLIIPPQFDSQEQLSLPLL